MSDRARGRVVLVTGANRGLGRETARQLAQRGATVLLGARDLDRGREAAADIAAGGGAVTPVRLDVTDPATVEAVAGRVAAEHGRLDGLVNNAGTIVEDLALEVTASHLRRTFEVNVFGVVTTIRAMLPLLRRATAACVVNVSSTTASLALTGSGASIPGDADRRLAYTSSKAALNMLTLQYARAFARDPELAHIRINSASPGWTATDMNAYRGTRHVSAGARIIVELATLPAGGPSGGFLHDDGPVPW
ncbi:SDR family NAD(P)-dependent oxidoreductase [Micromonospora sp. NPDC018662]|uniref:SDR family NAD(P)-dependent oxidoreductase n=1 Tax=Micromonospora sp. NPDC018662 TaxID=3364238 RepID=UPI0037B642F1